MINPYSIILGIFILTGIITSARGIYILALHKKTRNWPSTDGIITESAMKDGDGDLLPQIQFRYDINGETYQNAMRKIPPVLFIYQIIVKVKNLYKGHRGYERKT